MPTAFTMPLTGPPAPGACYLSGEDVLRVTSYNALASVALTARSRVVTLAGQVVASSDPQTPNTDRTAKTTILRVPEGWLLGVDVFVSSAAPLIGQTYVVVEVVRGEGSAAIPLQLLTEGYVTAKQPLAWPGAGGSSSLDGGGALRSIAGTTPAAGAEISEVVPTGARWELLAFRFVFTTSAVVANRFTSMQLDDGASLFYRIGAGATQAASLVTQGNAFPGADRGNIDAVNNRPYPLPIGNRLGAGFRIRTSTTNIDVGDQYSAVQYLVREWLEGA